MRIPRKQVWAGIACLVVSQSLDAQTETGPDRIRTVNPRYDLVRIRPTGFEPRVTAMAFRPDGKLVLATVGDIDTWTTGPGADAQSLYLLDGVNGADPDKITVKKIAGRDLIMDPMGLVILEGAYYVSDKDKLLKLEDKNGDDVIDSRTVAARWKWGGTDHEFAFGPIYRDGFFYLATSVQLGGPGPSAKVQNVDDRGTVLKVALSDGAVEVIAGGLRTPNGIDPKQAPPRGVSR